jgi:hypothetical protein
VLLLLLRLGMAFVGRLFPLFLLFLGWGSLGSTEHGTWEVHKTRSMGWGRRKTEGDGGVREGGLTGWLACWLGEGVRGGNDRGARVCYGGILSHAKSAKDAIF